MRGDVVRRWMFPGLAGLGAVLAAGAAAAPPSVQLVFSGHHGPPLGDGFRHEGPFTASSPFCPSGTVVDIAHQGQVAATRLYTCDDGSGTFTMQVTGYLAEHVNGGSGGWRVTEGTAAYVTLRGLGRWTSVPLTGDNEPFRSTLTGIADLDNTPPLISISRATATAVRRPAGTYSVRLAFVVRDNVAGNVVAYHVTVSAGTRSWARAGRTSSGTAAVTLAVRPPTTARRLRLVISASDPLENSRTAARFLKL